VLPLYVNSVGSARKTDTILYWTRSGEDVAASSSSGYYVADIVIITTTILFIYYVYANGKNFILYVYTYTYTARIRGMLVDDKKTATECDADDETNLYTNNNNCVCMHNVHCIYDVHRFVRSYAEDDNGEIKYV